jgi:aminoglycoside 2'-N-acetyltransferase I
MSLGWEQWRGLSYTLREGHTVADGEDEGLMILRIDGAAVRDLFVDVSCEDRPGDAW